MKKSEISEKIAAEDVEDVVEIASRMMQEDEESLSLKDLQDVGEELDIPAEYIERAQTALTLRREEEKKGELERKIAGSQRKMIVGGASAFSLLIIFVMIMSSMSSLRALHADVEAAQAQVQNVEERRVSVRQHLQNRPDSADKDAEIIGAENRVRVEKKRLAEAVSKYNAKARGPIGAIARSLSGLPESVPAR